MLDLIRCGQVYRSGGIGRRNGPVSPVTCCVVQIHTCDVAQADRFNTYQICVSIISAPNIYIRMRQVEYLSFLLFNIVAYINLFWRKYYGNIYDYNIVFDFRGY